MSPSILAISYFAHLIATVVWIGGLVTLTLFVWPETRRVLADNPALFGLLTRIRKRFAPLTNFSLVVLVLTGFVQMSGDANYEGALTFNNEWSRVMLAKHIAIFGMVICGLILQYAVVPALERASLLRERGKGDAAEWERLRRREVRLTWLNVALGIAVLGFTAWATAL
ncbi:MAG: CopD family protein [Anaerolineae bacterium]|nr:CopD family protein [Anaerolineae bacterium]